MVVVLQLALTLLLTVLLLQPWLRLPLLLCLGWAVFYTAATRAHAAFVTTLQRPLVRVATPILEACAAVCGT